MRRLLGFLLAAGCLHRLSSQFPLFDDGPRPRPSPRSAGSLRAGPAAPPPPSEDPWYRAPDGWEETAPGAVLRVRAAPHVARAIAHALAAWQVLFRTTNSSRGAAWAVTTVLVPGRHYRCRAGESERCGHALLSYQTPYDSASPDAGPSHALALAGEPGGAYGEVAEALFRGWFVSVPDYEGPAASYTAGVASGLATIDSVRAVLAAAGNWGMRSEDAKVAMFGYSGGALASEFAAGE